MENNSIYADFIKDPIILDDVSQKLFYKYEISNCKHLYL